MINEENIAVHLNPVWRDRADFIIMARLEDDVPGGRFEQLWARKLNGNLFEICCIPFFIYDLDLGDHVETTTEGEPQYLIRQIVWKSGHYSFRVWFKETTHPGSPDEVMNKMEEMGCLWEWHSKELLGLDAPSEEKAQQLSDYLAKEMELGHLIYETGRTG